MNSRSPSKRAAPQYVKATYNIDFYYEVPADLHLTRKTDFVVRWKELIVTNKSMNPKYPEFVTLSPFYDGSEDSYSWKTPSVVKVLKKNPMEYSDKSNQVQIVQKYAH